MAEFLVVFGANGAGKTRILKRIADLLPAGDAMCLGTETLVDELVLAARNTGGIGGWEEFYSAVDTLLLDNLWVIADRPVAARIFSGLIKRRMKEGKLTIAASDLSEAQWMEKNPGMAALLESAGTIQVGARTITSPIGG